MEAIRSHDAGGVLDACREMANDGKVKATMQHLLAMLATHYLTKNAWLLDAIATRCATIVRLKYSAKNTTVVASMCEVALFMANQHPSEVDFERYGSTDGVVVKDVSDARKDIVWVKNQCDVGLQGGASGERILVLCNALCNAMSSGNMHQVGAIAFHLLRTNHVATLWSVLGIYVHKAPLPGYPKELVKKYINSNASLFEVMAPAKRERSCRTPFLMVNFYMLCRKKPPCWVEEYKSSGIEEFVTKRIMVPHVKEVKATKVKENPKNPKVKAADRKGCIDVQNQLQYLMYYTTIPHGHERTRKSESRRPVVEDPKTINVTKTPVDLMNQMFPKHIVEKLGV